jgi:hypothetical protein
MRTLIATAALVAVIASPAFAQTRRAPVQQFDQSYGMRIAPPYAVFDGNKYLGADPDPNVRLLLRLDAEHRDF